MLRIALQAGVPHETSISFTTPSHLMFYYTYVLKDATGDLYIGWTADLETRLEQHQKGLVATTAKSLPVELVYYEACR